MDVSLDSVHVCSPPVEEDEYGLTFITNIDFSLYDCFNNFIIHAMNDLQIIFSVSLSHDKKETLLFLNSYR